MRGSQLDQNPLTGSKEFREMPLGTVLYSKWLLVRYQDGQESQAEYDRLHAAAHKYFHPVGWLEEDWVEKIVAWSWRLRLVIRYESGRISRALAEHSYGLQQSRVSDAEERGFAPSGNAGVDAMKDHLFLTTEGIETQVRYDAMINRQQNHAIAELEKLQARRKGEPRTASPQ